MRTPNFGITRRISTASAQAILCSVFLLQVTAGRSATFTDEALWRAAAGSWVLEGFEGIAAGTQLSSLPGLGVAFDVLNDSITFPSVQSVSNTGGTSVSGTQVLLNDIDFTLPGRGPIAMRPLDAGYGIQAVGYWNTGGDDSTILMFDDNNFLVESIESAAGLSFVGIVSASPVTRVEIAPGSSGNGYFTLDNLQVKVALVPEPASLTISCLGLWLFGVRMRRRTS